MKQHIGFFLVFAALLITGCTSSGAFLSYNETSVVLNSDNFVVASPNVSGEAETAYILGFSYSPGGVAANTLALARISGSGALYKEAIEDLWNNFEEENGSIENQSLALANVRYDSDIINLLLYTKVKVSVRADVIEFNR